MTAETHNPAPEAPDAKPGGSKLSLIIKALAAIVVSAVLLWWFFKDVDMAEIGRDLAATDWSIVALFAGTQMFIHLIRVLRWGLMVRSLGEVRWRPIFSAASVGLPASLFLPLRLGELVRPMMITRAGLPFASSMASVVVERVADGLTNVGLFFVLLPFIPTTQQLPPELQGLSRIALALFGGALIFLVIAYFARGAATTLIEKTLGRLSPGLSSKVIMLMNTFLDGLRALASPVRILTFVLLTAAYWGLNGWVTLMVARSYGADLPMIAGLFAMSVVVFAVMIPAAPGFAGTMEAGFRLGFGPFGVTPQKVAVIAIAVHATQLALMAVIAGVGLLAAEPSEKRR